MTPRLLEFYEKELRFIREMGVEFSKRYPKIAAGLDLGSAECADPYVERLIESFAFLTARIQLKMDAEYPRFTQHLLEIVYPHYLTPLPSMMVAEFNPDLKGGIAENGFLIPRNTKLVSKIVGGRSRCTFQTAHDIKIWPVLVKEAAYLPLGQVAIYCESNYNTVKSGLRIKLQAASGFRFNQIPIDQLTFYLYGTGNLPVQIYELIMGHGVSVVIQDPSDQQIYPLDKSILKPVGFNRNESLLPSTAQSFQGYRLLQEYFALPERFLFVQLNGLQSSMQNIGASELEIVILLDTVQDKLEHAIQSSNFKLNCAPAINLFEKQADRIHLKPQDAEHHLVIDKTRSNDFEVFSVLDVVGIGSDLVSEQPFQPFYSAYRQNSDVSADFAYYTIRRQPALQPVNASPSFLKTEYTGNEVYLSLVDASEAPYNPDIKQLGVRVLCTNRDLPKLIVPGEGNNDFSLEISAPLDKEKGIRCLAGPTEPKPSHAEGSHAWRLINHLSLNYLSLIDNDHQQGAKVLRDMLKLYGDYSEHAIAKQVEGLLSIETRPMTCRVPVKGPITFGRGLEITLIFDESAFAGGSCFLLGAILEQFFCKYASINSFTQVKVTTRERGEVMKWPVRTGTRALL
ncbi:MAG: type VI secretion system baseplate subunit TssF [Nitrosomonas sp.]|nr:type VI secretion system baseplate subunit TssF [Nitrosomonas sp.]